MQDPAQARRQTAIGGSRGRAAAEGVPTTKTSQNVQVSGLYAGKDQSSLHYTHRTGTADLISRRHGRTWWSLAVNKSSQALVLGEGPVVAVAGVFAEPIRLGPLGLGSRQSDVGLEKSAMSQPPTMPTSLSGDSSTANDGTAAVQAIHRRSKKLTEGEEYERMVVPKLASRSYHLPGNGFWSDYSQYIRNNHPAWGICCHSRLHPLKFKQRLVMLLASFAFGISITNIIYLWFHNKGLSDEEAVFSINYATRGSESQTYTVTNGLVALVTVGSATNAVFDRTIWSLSACGCCRPGGSFEHTSGRHCCADLGKQIVIFITVAIVSLSTLVVAIRASLDEGYSEEIPWIEDKNVTASEIKSMLNWTKYKPDDYSFLRGYALEWAFSLLVYYPMFETLLFSGVLGCGSIPVLGGRPYEMKKEEKAQLKMQSSCPGDLA